MRRAGTNIVFSVVEEVIRTLRTFLPRSMENTPEMIGDDYGMNSEGTTNETFFKRTVYQTRVWKRCYYWMPVFIDEYEKNPNLVQTPFWLE